MHEREEFIIKTIKSKLYDFLLTIYPIGTFTREFIERIKHKHLFEKI